MTIVEFLLARIAEDETAARDGGADAMTGHRWKRWPEEAYNEIQALALDRSRRTLAECEAKRLIVEESALWGCQKTMCKILALPYVGHPDYDEAWRP